MVFTRSSDVHVETLESIKQKLKRARDADDLRRTMAQLNRFRSAEWALSSHQVRATWYFLHGSLLSKSGRNNDLSGWLSGSSTERLQSSLALLQECLSELTKHAERSLWSGEMRNLEQSCTYEAHVVSTVLRVWGEKPDIMFGTDALSADQKRREAKARQHHFILSSQF